MREKMSLEDRAKQFLPFAALKGYQEALRAKEEIIVEPHVLSEDEKQILDLKFRELKQGDMVSLLYYEDSRYLKLTGVLTKIDWDNKAMTIIHKKIKISSIIDIQSKDCLIY